jgi:hypothetical protein
LQLTCATRSITLSPARRIPSRQGFALSVSSRLSQIHLGFVCEADLCSLGLGFGGSSDESWTVGE